MTGRILHGADEVVWGVFWDLGQIGDQDGPKYSEPVLRRLAAKVLEGRAHEPLVFRLCHLARAAAFAAEDGESGWLEFFCAPGAGRAGWAAGGFAPGCRSKTKHQEKARPSPPWSGRWRSVTRIGLSR